MRRFEALGGLVLASMKVSARKRRNASHNQLDRRNIRASMKALPRRKGNLAGATLSSETPTYLNKSPCETVGKC